MKKISLLEKISQFCSLSLASGKMPAALIFAIFIFLCSLSATPKTLLLGGEKGWDEFYSSEGVVVGKKNGQFGYDAIELSTRTTSANYATDLLLTFDDNRELVDETGNYSVTQNNLLYTEDAVKGGGAALSRGNKKGLTLSGNDSSLFGNSGFVGSFTIEFYLCPSLAENGEMVFSWRSSLNDDIRSEYQMITASFYNNHLEWAFNNIFVGFKAKELHISGFTTIVPKKWARHTISFDDETGLLEYLVDGRTEALVFVTKTGHENGTICYPLLGVKAGLELCPDYVGKIDNFKISRLATNRYSRDILVTGNEKYRVSGGKFITKPLLVSQSAKIEEIDTLMSLPFQTDIRFYIRSGDNCYGWTDSYPQWKEVVPGEKIDDVKGLYFQMMAEFLPDGDGKATPRLTEVTIKYDELPEPLPPFNVVAQAGDGTVRLSWSYSVDDNAGGYYVYYGNRPGEYLGRIAVQGSSPINVGNVTETTLTGLENGRIYYFAVSAYSKADGRINGTLSKEVFARPSSRLGKK